MDGKPPTYDELIDLTRRQARQIDELRAEVERLKAELEQSRRARKRQAAPFSKGSHKADPKRPGRKAGHPPSHRPPPPPDQVDRTIEVPLPPECPECRAPLDEAPVTVHDQYQIDLPEPKSVVTRFRVPVARCPACYRRVKDRHPEQTSDALGAAAVQFGPRLLGLADEHATLCHIRCFLAFDPLPFAKQKCLAHLLMTCGEVERSKTRGAVRFSRRVAALLRKAMPPKRKRAAPNPHGYAVARGRLHAELDRLLSGNLTDPDVDLLRHGPGHVIPLATPAPAGSCSR